jgi:hypothetical protein
MLGAAYFGPGAGRGKGQNLEVNEAMDGVGLGKISRITFAF